MSLDLILAGVILIALTFYVLMGGADFGAGVLSLVAGGPRAREQREVLASAIGPIWEANHVWLILVITVLFTAFPPAFALITTSLHIPLTLMLIGIVLRGSAFVFRTHDVEPSRPSTQARATETSPAGDLSRRAQVVWERVFSLSSLITPVLLGVTIGAIASGRLGVTTGSFLDVFVSSWLAPFPLAVGLFALALFTFLAGVYVILETTRYDLQEDFRRRALAAAVVVGILALVVFLLSATGAPEIRSGLAHSLWGRIALVTAVTAGVGAVVCLWTRRFHWARACAVAQVGLILWGWALAQYPYIVEPELMISNAAAPAATLRFLLIAILLGALLLFPSLYYLYRIFKSRAIFGESAS